MNYVHKSTQDRVRAAKSGKKISTVIFP